MSVRLFKSRYAAALAAILVVLLGWFSYGAFSESRLKAGIAAAARAMDAGNAIEARDRLASLARRWPGRAEILFRLGESELACGRIDEAMIAWSQIPQASPLRARSALAQAQVSLHAGRFSDAERILRDALKQPGPYANDLRHMLLVILGLEGRLEAARGLVEERFYEDDVPASERLALLRDHIALDVEPMPLEGNLEYLGASGATSSLDEGLWLARANLAIKTGRLDEAVRWLDALEMRRGSDPDVWRARLEWAVASGRLDKAREAMARLKAHDLSEQEIARLSGWIAQQYDDVKSEQAALEKALAQDPGDLVAIERLSELAFRAGKPDKARRLRSRKSELDALKDRYYRLYKEDQLETSTATMARLAEALGRDFEARSLWVLLSEINPGDPKALSELTRLRRPPPTPRSGSSESLSQLLAGAGNNPKTCAGAAGRLCTPSAFRGRCRRGRVCCFRVRQRADAGAAAPRDVQRRRRRARL